MQNPPWPFVFKLENVDGHLSLPEPISPTNGTASFSDLVDAALSVQRVIIPAHLGAFEQQHNKPHTSNKVYKVLAGFARGHWADISV